jgi:hypothetical protein
MMIKTADRELYNENTRVFGVFRCFSALNPHTTPINSSYKMVIFWYSYDGWGVCCK